MKEEQITEKILNNFIINQIIIILIQINLKIHLLILKNNY